MTFTNSSLLHRTESSGSESSSAENQRPLQRTKIVLAEGNPIDLEHIGSLLETFGFEILSARDGWTAFEYARAHQPSLVISSLALPALDGYKLSQKIKEDPLTEGIPFMFIMSAGEFPDRLIGHQTYAHDYIQKPVSVPEFKSRVQALLKLDRNGARRAGRGADTDPDSPETLRPATLLSESASEGKAATLDAGSLHRVLGETRDLLRRLALQLERLEHHMAGSDKIFSAGPAFSGSGESSGSEMTDGEDSTRGRKPSPRGSGSGHPDQEQPLPGAEGGEGIASPSSASAEELLERYRAEFRKKGQRKIREVVDDIDEIFDAFLGPRKGSSTAVKEAEEAPRKPVPEESAPSPSPQAEPKTAQPDETPAQPDAGLEGPSQAPLSGGVDLPEDVFFDPELLDRFLSRDEVRQSRDEREAVPASLYDRLKEYVLRAILGSAEDRVPDVEAGLELTDELIRSLDNGRELLLEATDREQEYSVIGHSVNVAVLATHLARNLGRSIGFQRRLCLAALLHEVGVIALPAKLIFKEEKLSAHELKELRKRPFYSGRILEKLPEPHNELGEVVSQVYERDNGAGYPRALKRGQIREEARIMAVADVFEACIHKRPYKNPLTGYQALYELSTDPTRTFSDELVKLLIRSLSLFPLNERLVLSDGRKVRVVEVDDSDLTRPVVEILEGDGENEQSRIRLSEYPALRIVEVLNPGARPADE